MIIIQQDLPIRNLINPEVFPNHGYNVISLLLLKLVFCEHIISDHPPRVTRGTESTANGFLKQLHRK